MCSLLGLFVLSMWLRGEWRATAFGIAYVPTAPITALLFVLLGLGQVASWLWPERRVAVWFGQAGAISGVVVSIIALGQSWMGYPLAWEAWFGAAKNQIGAIPLGRMAPLTAVAFLLSTVAILANRRRGPVAPGISIAAGTCSLLIGLIVIAGYAAGLPLNYGGGTVPMAWLTALGFVLLNGSVLLTGSAFDAMRGRWIFINSMLPGAPDRIFKRRLATLTLLLGVLIVAFGLIYVRHKQGAARDTVKRELDAVANLKASQLIQWREERLSEGRFLQRVPAVAAEIAAFLTRSDDPAAEARVRGWLDPIRGGERYESVLVYDADRRLRLAITGGANAALDTSELKHAIPSDGGVALSDLEHHPGDLAPHFVVIVPILQPGQSNAGPGSAVAPIATILLRLNPRYYLYPLIQAWPLPSRTAETLLVRREGDDVLFLNELRHQSGAPLTLRRSIHAPYLPSAIGLRGASEAQEGLDYRGVAVVAAMRPIHGSTWHLVAKIDLAEVYEPVRDETLQSGFMVALLLLTVGLGASFVWRQRQAFYLKRALAAEQERVALAGRLSLVMQHANDSILLLDEQGRILESNQRGLAMYGYTLEELQQLPPGGLRAPEAAADRSRQFALFEQPGGALYETIQRRKDGSTFPVEIGGTTFELDGRKFKLAVQRDVSQRKAYERQLERMNRLYAALSQVNQTIVHATDRNELLQGICRVLVKHGGFKMAWIGWRDSDTQEIKVAHKFGDETGYLDNLRCFADDRPGLEAKGPTGTAVRESRTDVCNDVMTEPRLLHVRDAAARSGYRSLVALPVKLNGETCAALTVYATEPNFFAGKEIVLLEEAAMDIAFGLENLDRDERRRLAERALAAAEERYRNIFENAVEGIYQTSPDGSFLSANPAMAQILGFDSPEALIRERRDIGQQGYVDPAIREEFKRRIEADGIVIGFEYEAWRNDGTKIWISENARVVRDSAGRVICYEGSLADITGRRIAQNQIVEQLEELRRWHEATLGREERILELKQQVNELLARAGAAPRYRVDSA